MRFGKVFSGLALAVAMAGAARAQTQGDSLSILLRNELPAGPEENDTNLHFHGGHVSPPLVNGQVQPVITMAPGEVQRWRFVNATAGPLSQLDLRFPPGATVCPQAPGSFGKARPGGQPECVAGNLIKAAPSCLVPR